MQHSQLVKDLVKNPEEIRNELTIAQANILHMAVGIAGEAGELLDAIKKHCIYQKPLDMENIIEELGDLEFYMEGLRQELLIVRQDTLDHNIKKLSKRYPQGTYTNVDAQERKDK